MKRQMTCKPVEPVLHLNANVSLKEQIAQRAHELWIYRGHQPGKTQRLQAEQGTGRINTGAGVAGPAHVL
jgi:hypothetical protein